MSSKPAEIPTLEARARLMRAAEKLFARKGYAAAAVHEITDAAGVNRALLYYYFEDKHSLYAAVLAEGTDEFHRMLESALSGPGSSAERLAAVIRGHLALVWERGDMARVVHRCLLDGLEEEFGLVEKYQRAMERLEGFFRDAIASGEFRAGDAAITARTILGPTFALSLCRDEERSRFSREAIAEELTARYLHGLLAR